MSEPIDDSCLFTSPKQQAVQPVLRDSAALFGGGPVVTPEAAGVAERSVVAASRGQRRLWFLSQLEPEAPLFNVPYRLRLSGALRSDVLRAALRAVVSRHEPLRTAFAV